MSRRSDASFWISFAFWAIGVALGVQEPARADALQVWGAIILLASIASAFVGRFVHHAGWDLGAALGVAGAALATPLPLSVGGALRLTVALGTLLGAYFVGTVGSRIQATGTQARTVLFVFALRRILFWDILAMMATWAFILLLAQTPGWISVRWPDSLDAAAPEPRLVAAALVLGVATTLTLLRLGIEPSAREARGANSEAALDDGAARPQRENGTHAES